MYLFLKSLAYRNMNAGLSVSVLQSMSHNTVLDHKVKINNLVPSCFPTSGAYPAFIFFSPTHLGPGSGSHGWLSTTPPYFTGWHSAAMVQWATAPGDDIIAIALHRGGGGV